MSSGSKRDDGAQSSPAAVGTKGQPRSCSANPGASVAISFRSRSIRSKHSSRAAEKSNGGQLAWQALNTPTETELAALRVQ